jgi:preprotein translocase subunit SecB
MSDDQAILNGSNPNAQVLGTLTVNAQYVRDLSFENPNAPNIYLPQDNAPQPNVELMVNVQSRTIAEGAFEVVLTLKATSKLGDQIGFIAELAYAGVFSVPALPEPLLRSVLLVDCPQLLFPFARAILSDMVRDGNFPPLLVAPIDFAGLYRQQDDAEPARASA